MQLLTVDIYAKISDIDSYITERFCYSFRHGKFWYVREEENRDDIKWVKWWKNIDHINGKYIIDYFEYDTLWYAIRKFKHIGSNVPDVEKEFIKQQLCN